MFVKVLILAAIILTAAACATRTVDPLLIPPDHDAQPTTNMGG